MDNGYLGRSVTARTYEAESDFRSSIDTVMCKASAAGMLGSSNTLRSFRNEALRVFGEKFNETAQFVYNFTESNDGNSISTLGFYAKNVISMFMRYLRDAGMRLGLTEHLVAGEITRIEVSLEEKSTQLLEDFKNGMMGSVRMKKDEPFKVVLNQTNSPSAVQQVGFGQSTQTARIQNYQQLTAAIDAALQSEEFNALTDEHKNDLQDIADVLKGEASKPHPDNIKLSRWGEKIVALAQQVGLQAASVAIANALKVLLGG